jgi:hypothetical protein
MINKFCIEKLCAFSSDRAGTCTYRSDDIAQGKIITKGMLAQSESKVRKWGKLGPEKLREYIKNNPDKTLKQIRTAVVTNPASVTCQDKAA